MRRLVSTGICLLLLAACASQPLTPQQLEAKAQVGDAEAAFKLGCIYFHGMGEPQDFPKAAQWFERAAAKGHAQAAYCYWLMNRNAIGVPYDTDKVAKLELAAAALLEKAANGGDAKAMLTWVQLRTNSDGTPLTDAQRFVLLKRAAEAGDVEAMCQLGERGYLWGEGVPRDSQKGLAWIRKAADKGCAHAMFKLGYIYERGFGKPDDYANADEWLSGVAERWPEKDMTQAIQWYERGATLGDFHCMAWMGNLYLRGTEVPQDIPKALAWYEQAAAIEERGNCLGYVGSICLATAYFKGEYVPRDYAKAAFWGERWLWSGNSGTGYASLLLGKGYASGQGVPQNNLKAYIYLSLPLDWSSEKMDPERKQLLAEVCKRLSAEEVKQGDAQVAALKLKKTYRWNAGGFPLP